MSEVPRLTELLRDSDEWARVEYFLSWSMEKLALNSPGGDDEISSKLSGVVHQNGPDSGIAIRGLWSICTPGTHHHQYLKLSKDHLSVDGWRFLEVASGAEAVASHDFRSSILNGFKNWKGFMSGKVSMESCGWVNKGNKCGSREIIGVLSNVVVGDSFLVSGEQFPIDEIDLSLDLELSNKFGSLPPIPADYHSAHISEVNGKDTGSHVYFVKNSSQILPMYMVQFTLYEDKEAGNGSRDSTMYTQGICQVCEKQPATIYCVPDKTDMCAKCDRDVHSANKVVRSHQRVPISEKTQYQEEIYGYCTDHKNIEREFFCTICRVPVCVHCKMIGSHSSGSFASHKLTPIQEAYQGIIQIANQEDKLIASKKSQLEKQIALLSEKVDLINKNTKLVEKQIREKADQALKQLEELSWQKVTCIHQYVEGVGSDFFQCIFR